jgi:hypothetical protein
MSDVSVPPSTQPGASAVSRIVEVRACHPDAGSNTASGPGLYRIDWGDTQGAVVVAGNLIFNGDILMKGLGWRAQSAAGGLDSVVGALTAQVRGPRGGGQRAPQPRPPCVNQRTIGARTRPLERRGPRPAAAP